MSYRASLIISIYDNIPFLKAVLDSLAYQTEKNVEVIISEDAAHPDVAAFIRTYPFVNDYQHITQPDEGWRKNKALNNAIRTAKARWLIFIDGDCVLHPQFVEWHVKMASEDFVLTGNRVKLNQQLSTMLQNDPSRLLSMTAYLCKAMIFNNGMRHVEEGFFLSPDGPFRALAERRRVNGLIGSNMSFSKNMIERINGFDEDYIRPAIGEDSDLHWRFQAAGYGICSLRNVAVQYHLFHKENWKSQEENALMMEAQKAKNEFVCKNGLIKL